MRLAAYPFAGERHQRSAGPREDGLEDGGEMEVVADLDGRNDAFGEDRSRVVEAAAVPAANDPGVHGEGLEGDAVAARPVVVQLPHGHRRVVEHRPCANARLGAVLERLAATVGAARLLDEE